MRGAALLDDQPNTLNENCYLAVKQDIIRCRLEAGRIVSESELCTEYNFGKAPVRNTLSRLAQEGLVKAIGRKGYQIAPLTIKDIQDMYEMRLILEPAALRLAFSRHTRDELQRIGHAILDLARQEDGESGEADPYDRLIGGMVKNRQFHVTVANASGNLQMSETIAKLIEKAERTMHLWMSKGADIGDNIVRQDNDHVSIASCLIDLDLERGEKLLTEHLANASAETIRAVLKNAGGIDLAILSNSRSA